MAPGGGAGASALAAQRAYDVGLVNAVVPPGEAMARALGMAARIAANAPLAVRAVKRVGGASPGLTLTEAFRIEDEAAREIMRSADAKEGASAFAERRPPRFTGR